MDNNNYTERIGNYIKDLCIDNSTDYSEELQNYINLHNTSLAEFCQSMLSSSLLSILIKKGIITDDEIVSEFDIFLNSSKQKEMLESNRDQLMQCIEAEKDYNKELENMYEDMKSRVDITDQEFYKSSDTSYVDELFN